ncbi:MULTISPECIES: cytochrome c oxidase subunit 3 [unclassified Cellulophaga]|uniref:cytochrome c oxidase subunit 3 n=1 Tax=unclassified Cellulophaga TaxID=2634405 RepID=UPI000C2CD16E|nr:MULTISPECIES: cytochrome c oxidase subunit 3 [unclassified Cellulophaga]MDO6490292.1 cytochrome c oxidase subunit 3 [Cellulophaga sp. 2_MG-2023]MDO6494514.1 cytochrome c oxidase subunit 3 [Cellulophaga sp. 3_MG-2023]PKB42100.1 cytochrome c oxidase subunit 3 [Cellulophaga sp. RHA19]
MDLTQKSEKEKSDNAKKMMLWFGIVSLIMAFAGWTSAYIVSSSREDWLKDFDLPSAFFWSTLIIVVSSITYFLAVQATKKDKKSQATTYLLVTLALGIIFIVLQFVGFSQLIGNGFYFTGPTSSITMSYIFLIAVVHVAHVVAGLVSLIVVIVNQLKNKYSSTEVNGLEIGATFWHFLDLLWVYLILFFYLYR